MPTNHIKWKKKEQHKSPTTLSFSGSSRCAGAQAEGMGCGDGPWVWGSCAFLLLGQGRMDAGVPLLRWVWGAVLGGGQTTQNAVRAAPGPPCKKQCNKNVLNPQTQTRFACHKLQGRFGKEFATRKVVAGWMLNIWGGDVHSGGMLSWGRAAGTVGNNYNQVIIEPFPKGNPFGETFLPWKQRCLTLCPAHPIPSPIQYSAPSLPAASPASNLSQPGDPHAGKANGAVQPIFLLLTSLLWLL